MSPHVDGHLLSRRRFVRGLGFAGIGLLVACGRLPGQAVPTKIPRIGFIAPASPNSTESNPEGFRRGLEALGYVEGQSIVIEWRFVEGQFERIPAIVGELINAPVDVIVAAGRTIRAAQQATQTIPIVMSWAGFDPIAEGIIASLAQPGGNVTGISSISPRLSGKRVELLQAIVPAAARIAVLWDAGDPLTRSRVGESQNAGSVLGVDVRSLEFHGAGDLESAFDTAVREHTDGLIVVHNSVTGSLRAPIVALAARTGLPTMYENRDWTQAGGLIAYGASVPGMYYRAAYFVDRILKGAKPADLPVEQPREFDCIINLQTVQALGLTIPQHVLLQATEVIQ